MKSTTAISIALAAASHFVGTLAHSPSEVIRSDYGPPKQEPSTTPVHDEPTSQGCFSSKGNLTTVDSEPSMLSAGSCANACQEGDYAVFAVGGTHCYCGNAYPPKSSVVDDDKCNYPCPAYPLDACGGIDDGGYWSVYNSGVHVDVPFYDGKDGGSGSSSTGTEGPTSTMLTPTTTASNANGGSTGTVTTAVTTAAPGSNSTTTEQSPSGTGQSSATPTPDAAAGPMATQMPLLAVVAALVGGAVML